MQRPHHHHRNHSVGGQDNGISQVLLQLGQDLQSGVRACSHRENFQSQGSVADDQKQIPPASLRSRVGMTRW
jgi:hypothetical protein